MCPKVGRPPKDNPKSVKLNIRLTEECSKDLQYCADTLHISRTEVIEKGIQKVKTDIKE